MNIGLLLPVVKKRWKPLSIKTQIIEAAQDLNFIVCTLPCTDNVASLHPNYVKKVRVKLDKLFESYSVWTILEHPILQGLYQNDLSFVVSTVRKIAIERFYELIRSIRGLGRLNKMEVLITGLSPYLEYVIEKIITKVKTVNILIPEGMEEPAEAEKAFFETGIPIHITTDKDILNRNRLWLRFPDDDKSFDALPQKFEGTIVDFGALNLIDTQSKKIFPINIEFSGEIKRRLGQQLASTWPKGTLEGFVVSMYAAYCNINDVEASKKLGTRISFNS